MNIEYIEQYNKYIPFKDGVIVNGYIDIQHDAKKTNWIEYNPLTTILKTFNINGNVYDFDVKNYVLTRILPDAEIIINGVKLCSTGCTIAISVTNLNTQQSYIVIFVESSVPGKWHYHNTVVTADLTYIKNMHFINNVSLLITGGDRYQDNISCVNLTADGEIDKLVYRNYTKNVILDNLVACLNDSKENISTDKRFSEFDIVALGYSHGCIMFMFSVRDHSSGKPKYNFYLCTIAAWQFVPVFSFRHIADYVELINRLKVRYIDRFKANIEDCYVRFNYSNIFPKIVGMGNIEEFAYMLEETAINTIKIFATSELKALK